GAPLMTQITSPPTGCRLGSQYQLESRAGDFHLAPVFKEALNKKISKKSPKKKTESTSPVVLHGIEDFQIDDVHLGLVRVCDNQVFFFDKDGILHCFNFLEPYLF
ncbi:unnamed protein product, partial [Oikopleura dioica]